MVTFPLLFGLLGWLMYDTLTGTLRLSRLSRQDLKLDIFNPRQLIPVARSSLGISLVIIGGISLSLVFETRKTLLQWDDMTIYAILVCVTVLAFFQAVRAQLIKRAPGETKPEEELNLAVRQIVSKAITPDGVVDIFSAAGLKKPDISILSDEFLTEVRGMPQQNLAVELLRKLLAGEIKTRSRKNLVQARSFVEMLEEAIRRYQNRTIEAAQVIEELIGLAKKMREANARGEQLNLTEDELAFYDALETNDSAVKVLGDETLRTIARELVISVRKNVKIDWTIRENVRSQLRVIVKRILRKYNYPPDKQEKATQTVLEQAEVLSETWAE